jgi:hypothetical protein
VQRVKNFAVFLGRSPDTASFEDVRRYQLHLVASKVGVPTINQTVSTLPRAGDTGSADRDRPTGFVIPLIASRTSVQQTSATDRRRRNPHSV